MHYAHYAEYYVSMSSIADPGSVVSDTSILVAQTGATPKAVSLAGLLRATKCTMITEACCPGPAARQMPPFLLLYENFSCETPECRFEFQYGTNGRFIPV